MNSSRSYAKYFLLNGFLVVLILLTRRGYAESLPETISKFPLPRMTEQAAECGQKA
jgi:hypothetical protein